MSFISSIAGGVVGGALSSFVSTGNNGLTSMINSAMNSYVSGALGGNTGALGVNSGINTQAAVAAAMSSVTRKVNSKAYAPSKVNISCFIINLTTNESVTFECEPEDITDTNSNNFDAVDIRGRSSPYQGYNNSGPRTISFSVNLHSDLCTQGLQNTINKLKALTYPIYDGGVIIPPMAYFHIGYMISCRCIVNSVDITFHKPIRDHFYINCEASFSLTEVRDGDKPLSAPEVSANGQYTYS